MAHALEVRPPFLDHRIVQFAATLPANLKVRGRRRKVLLKELLREQAAASRPASEEDGIRHPSARIDARSATGDVDGNRFRRGFGSRRLVPAKRTAGIRESSSRPPRESRLPPLGLMILFLWMKKWGIQSTTEPRIDRAFPQPAPTLS